MEMDLKDKKIEWDKVEIVLNGHSIPINPVTFENDDSTIKIPFVYSGSVSLIPIEYEEENSDLELKESDVTIIYTNGKIESKISLSTFEYLKSSGKMFYNEKDILTLDLRDLHPYTLEQLDEE